MDRSATVEVLEDSKVLVVGPDTFESLLKNSPEIAMKMLKKMARGSAPWTTNWKPTSPNNPQNKKT